MQTPSASDPSFKEFLDNLKEQNDRGFATQLVQLKTERENAGEDNDKREKQLDAVILGLKEVKNAITGKGNPAAVSSKGSPVTGNKGEDESKYQGTLNEVKLGVEFFNGISEKIGKSILGIFKSPSEEVDKKDREADVSSPRQENPEADNITTSNEILADTAKSDLEVTKQLLETTKAQLVELKAIREALAPKTPNELTDGRLKAGRTGHEGAEGSGGGGGGGFGFGIPDFPDRKNPPPGNPKSPEKTIPPGNPKPNSKFFGRAGAALSVAGGAYTAYTGVTDAEDSKQAKLAEVQAKVESGQLKPEEAAAQRKEIGNTATVEKSGAVGEGSGIAAGGIAGSVAGAKLGATVGLAFGGLGAVPGAVIGGLAGGTLGAFAGSSAGKYVGETVGSGINAAKGFFGGKTNTPGAATKAAVAPAPATVPDAPGAVTKEAQTPTPTAVKDQAPTAAVEPDIKFRRSKRDYSTIGGRVVTGFEGGYNLHGKKEDVEEADATWDEFTNAKDDAAAEAAAGKFKTLAAKIQSPEYQEKMKSISKAQQEKKKTGVNPAKEEKVSGGPGAKNPVAAITPATAALQTGAVGQARQMVKNGEIGPGNIEDGVFEIMGNVAEVSPESADIIEKAVRAEFKKAIKDSDSPGAKDPVTPKPEALSAHQMLAQQNVARAKEKAALVAPSGDGSGTLQSGKIPVVEKKSVDTAAPGKAVAVALKETVDGKKIKPITDIDKAQLAAKEKYQASTSEEKAASEKLKAFEKENKFDYREKPTATQDFLEEPGTGKFKDPKKQEEYDKLKGVKQQASESKRSAGAAYTAAEGVTKTYEFTGGEQPSKPGDKGGIQGKIDNQIGGMQSDGAKIEALKKRGYTDKDLGRDDTLKQNYIGMSSGAKYPNKNLGLYEAVVKKELDAPIDAKAKDGQVIPNETVDGKPAAVQPSGGDKFRDALSNAVGSAKQMVSNGEVGPNNLDEAVDQVMANVEGVSPQSANIIEKAVRAELQKSVKNPGERKSGEGAAVTPKETVDGKPAADAKGATPAAAGPARPRSLDEIAMAEAKKGGRATPDISDRRAAQIIARREAIKTAGPGVTEGTLKGVEVTPGGVLKGGKISNTGKDVAKTSTENADMGREAGKGGANNTVVSNNVSSNNTTKFVPMKANPRPEYTGSSLDRYTNRITVY